MVQFVDTIPLRRWLYSGVHQDYPKPLKSPIWHQLGSVYENLIVLPAWQCAPRSSPGGAYGYRTFGYLAAEQKMRINSYYTARYTGLALDYHCNQPNDQFAHQPLSPDSAMLSPLPSPLKSPKAQPARASVMIWTASSCVLQKRTSGLVHN